MQPSAATPASPQSRSFAGLLADFAAPEKELPPARDLDGLTDDVVMLTYEHALRTHARYRPVEDMPEVPDPGLHSGPAPVATEGTVANVTAGAHATAAIGERKLSSVTVRLTAAENELLRRRAAEAGMTVSAYLRSCAFEVESLRSQVKQTIAELRTAESASEPAFRWWRIFPWVRKAT